MPFQPTGYVPQSGDRIIDLLMQRGDNAARAAERSGAIWGNAVNQVGQIAAGAVQQYGEEKSAKKQAAALDEFVQSGEWMKDPRVAIAGSVKILGPSGIKFAEGLIGATKMQNAQTPTEARTALPMVARGFKAAPDMLKPGLWVSASKLMQAAGLVQPGQLPEEYSKDMDPFIDSIAAEGGGSSGAGFELSPGQTRFDPSGKPIASLPPTPMKPAPTLEQIQAEAEARARGTRAGNPPAPASGSEGTWSEAEGPDGQPILFNVKTGETKSYPKGVGPKPGTMEKNRRGAAENSIVSGEAILGRLETPELKKALGPVTGRYNSLMQAFGAGDPVAVELVGDLKSFSALQPAVHGFRAVQMAKDVEKLLNTKQTPESLAAGIKGILSASYIVAHQKPSDEEGWVSIPGGRIKEVK